MATYKLSKLKVIQILKDKEITLFTRNDFEKIFGQRNPNSLKYLLRGLRQEKIIERLTKSRYLFLHAQRVVSDFEIANFLVMPSYISLESALSLHGVLEQFPYQITSITTCEPRTVKSRGKLFVYSRIKKDYFKDYIKSGQFLIAPVEKALFDYLYFVYKGLRSLRVLPNISQYLRKNSMRVYLAQNADPRFLSFIQKNVEL